MYAINYTIRKINQGQKKYLNDLLSLYEDTLQNEIIMDGGVLSPWSYKNIVSVALRVNRYDWVETFIHDYKDRMASRFRENAFNYNFANLSFHRKEFDKALVSLTQVEFSDIYYNLDSKLLMLKVFYELDETEALLSHIHAFKIYLRRTQLISSYMQEVYWNLAEYTRQLTKFSTQSKERLLKLKEEVQSVKKVADLNWLLEKIEETILQLKEWGHSAM